MKALLQKELIEPAVNGTKNVLEAVAKSKDSVKRVVLTSSFAGNPSFPIIRLFYTVLYGLTVSSKSWSLLF